MTEPKDARPGCGEVVDRVARIMWERSHDGEWPHDAEPAALDIYRGDAAVAIDALRWPTEAMWSAWRSVNCRIGTGGSEEFTSFDGDYGNWLACHQAMIDAALARPTEPVSPGERRQRESGE